MPLGTGLVGWRRDVAHSCLPTCCTGSCVMVLLLQPFLHLEITGVGRESSQTCSDPFEVSRLWNKPGSTSGEALLLLSVSQPGQAFPRIFHTLFLTCLLVCWNETDAASGGRAGCWALLPILWDSKNQIKQWLCQRQSGAAI